MLLITTRPGSAVHSNGSIVCMIGGDGNLPAKMARTKSRPDIAAITAVGVTPNSGAGWSDMAMLPVFDDGHHIKSEAHPQPCPGRSAAPLRQCAAEPCRNLEKMGLGS